VQPDRERGVPPGTDEGGAGSQGEGGGRGTGSQGEAGARGTGSQGEGGGRGTGSQGEGGGRGTGSQGDAVTQGASPTASTDAAASAADSTGQAVAAADGVPRDHGLAARLRWAGRWETGLAAGVVLIAILGSMASPQFLTGNNFFNIGITIGEIAIMTLPMTLIIISGEIDLSVASILGMSSALLGLLWSDHWPMIAIFAMVAVAGAAAGAINGLLVTRLGLPSLAVTIGTLALYRGVALILLGSRTVSNFPATYTNAGVNALPHTNIPYSIGIFIVLALVFGVVLHTTPFGRSIYAMGASPEAAMFAGIRVKRTKTSLFIVSGVICALAGVLWTFRLATAVQNNGIGQELAVVAIVLLGGVSIFGGKGSIAGVVLAVIAYAGIQNALLLTNFNQEATGIVTGALLLVSVFAPNAPALWSRLREGIATRRNRSPSALGDGP
jgi:rhamnose transport system permease protein